MWTCDRLDPGLSWLFGLLGALLALAASAPTGLAAEPVLPTAGPAQREGGPHPGPPAYHAMCARDPMLCHDDEMAGRQAIAGPVATLTPGRWKELLRLNAAINAQIRAVEDPVLFGQADYWTRGVHSGDCEDYMVAKKLALISAGRSADQLLYAVVEGWGAGYHAVLVVRTDRGDLVLDNLEPAVRHWEETGYRFVIRQQAARPTRWVRVLGAGTAPGGLRTSQNPAR